LTPGKSTQHRRERREEANEKLGYKLREKGRGADVRGSHYGSKKKKKAAKALDLRRKEGGRRHPGGGKRERSID